MSEIITTLKLFGFSLVLLMLLQTKWNGITLERQALISLHQSHVGQTIEEVAMGATKAIRKGYDWTKSSTESLAHSAWSQVSSNSASSPNEQKAGR